MSGSYKGSLRKCPPCRCVVLQIGHDDDEASSSRRPARTSLLSPFSADSNLDRTRRPVSTPCVRRIIEQDRPVTTSIPPHRPTDGPSRAARGRGPLCVTLRFPAGLLLLSRP